MSVAASLLGILVATGAVMYLGWLALDTPTIPRDIKNTAQLFDAVKIGLAVVAGLAAAVGLTVSYRRQRSQEEDAYTSRYTSAAEQLGHERAAVRLAGAYALARLADDWKAQRQTCIDVLCAYLRMPYKPDITEPVFGENWPPTGEREVRLSVLRIMRDHLRAKAPVSWQGHDFDLTGGVFDGGSLEGAVFSGGTVTFEGATFVTGDFDISSAVFSGGYVSFGFANFEGGTVDFGNGKFSGCTVDFGAASLSGADLDFQCATFTDGEVTFGGARFRDGRVDFESAEFTGGDVSFIAAHIAGGSLHFGDAHFKARGVSFDDAYFEGGTVDMSHARYWEVAPSGLPAATTPGLLMPQAETDRGRLAH